MKNRNSKEQVSAHEQNAASTERGDLENERGSCRSGDQQRRLDPTPPSVEALTAGDDANNVDLLIDYVDKLQESRKRDFIALAPSLPVGLRTVYAVTLVVHEVYNGGFEQLFCNQGLAVVRYAVESLRRLGMDDAAELVLEAKNVFEIELATNPQFAEAPIIYESAAIQAIHVRFWKVVDFWDVTRRLVALVRSDPSSCIPTSDMT